MGQLHVSFGEVVRYQCDSNYNGTPIAVCGVDGLYVVQQHCKRECSSPPAILDATPKIDNTLAILGWIEGTGVTYICNPGFEGSITAICGSDGNYSIAGRCDVASSVKTDQLSRNVQK